MNKNWIMIKDKLPPQGKKVLCWDNGDCYICMRYKHYWLPFPFLDSKFSPIDTPEMWMDIEFPTGFYGLNLVSKDGCFYNMDEFEIKFPKEYEELVEKFITYGGEI